MATKTLRCEVVRQQAPPYQRFTTAYHEWPKSQGVVIGCCRHCGLFPDQVKVRTTAALPKCLFPRFER